MGLVVLPLAMAFGVAPQPGLYKAVVAGFFISALGGSTVQIGGPTGAFVVIVPGIVSRFGIARLSLVTLLAGVLLVIMEVTGFGSAVKFIRRPVIIGFTNGIALLIASTPFRGLPQENQIKDFLGLRTGLVPSSLVQWQAVAVAGSTLAIVLLWLRLNRRIPGSILPC